MLKIKSFRKLTCFAISLLCIFLQAVTVRAVIRDGQLDPDFAITPISFSLPGRIDSLVQQPDGKILVGGSFANVSGGAANNIARLNADGSFDSTFNIGSGANQTVDRIFVLSDGKILISGNFLQFNGTARNRVARLNPDGSLDTSFNPNLGTTFVRVTAVQPDGKVIITGSFTSIGGVTRNGIARLNPDGGLDLSFDGAGGPSLPAVNKGLVQPDGKIVLCGRFTSYNGVPRVGIVRINSDGSLDTGFVPEFTGTSHEFFDMGFTTGNKIYLVADYFGNKVFRLNTNGSIDTSFNNGANETTSARVYALAAQPDGKVVVGGEFDGFWINGQLNLRQRLCRFNADGTIDATFTGQGENSGGIRTLASQSDGKILAGGDFRAINGVPRGGIARVDSNGGTDTSFVGFFGTPTTVDTFYLLPGGKMYIGGNFHTLGSSFGQNCARLNPDGSVDTSFVIDPSVDTLVSTIAVQPDGKVLLGGYNGGEGTGRGLWRVNADGTRDTTFTVQIGNFEFVRTIALQADGKILIGGDFNTINGTPRPKIARLHPNGSLDTTFNPSFSGLAIGKIVVQPDGNILVGGNFTSVNGASITGVARIKPDGTTDTNFNIGTGATGGGASVSAILVTGSGKIYVGGSFSTFNGSSRTALVRLNSDGSFDDSFKRVRIFSAVLSVIEMPNNKILIGGSTSAFIDAQPRERIIRLLNDGSVDYSFDVGKMFRNGSSGSVSHLALQSEGKILAAGSFDTVNGVNRWGLMRLNTFARIPAPIFDYDGDGKSDVSVFRPSDGFWYRINSYLNQTRLFPFGIAGDKTMPGDFDGDFRTDVAVYRASEGNWYIQNSSDLSYTILHFGVEEDIPVARDFDGDGKTDIAVFRPSTGDWYLLQSQAGFTSLHFGASGDVPTAADFDGDGKADIAVFRPSEGNWYVLQSTLGLAVVHFGQSGDLAVPADFDGDFRTDIAVFRPSTGTWYALKSSDGNALIVNWGLNGDKPVSADYDGDNKADVAIYRGGAWYILFSSTGGYAIVNFGLADDVPLGFMPN